MTRGLAASREWLRAGALALPVVAAAALLAEPGRGALVVAACLAAAGCAVGLRALVHRVGAQALWLAGIALAIVLGEMSAIPFGGQSGRLLWADAVVGVGVLVALARGDLALELPRARVATALLPWLAWSAATLLIAAEPLTAVAELKEWAVALVVLLAALRFATDESRVRWLLGVTAAVSTVIAVLMIRTALSAPMGWVLAVLLKKVDLPWGRTNYLAGLLILGIPVTCGMLGAARRVPARVLLVAALVVQAAGLAFSASKGAILALVVAFAVGFLPARRASRWAPLAMLALIGGGVALFALGPLHRVLAYRLQASAVAYSVGERMDLYRLAWETFLARPIAGIGMNDFSVVSNRLTGVDTVPHNLELGLLAESGLIGAILAGAWIAAIAAAAWRARRGIGPARVLGLGVWTAFLGFFLHNQSESTLYGEQYKILLALVVAAAWRLAHPDACESHDRIARDRAGGNAVSD